MEGSWNAVSAKFQSRRTPEVTLDSRDTLKRPDVRYGIGATYLSRAMPHAALSRFQGALQLDPEHTRSLLGASRAYLGWRRLGVCDGKDPRWGIRQLSSEVTGAIQ